MANWACGTLKVRGTYSELKNFLENGIENVKIMEYDGWMDAVLKKDWCHLKGTHRGFVVESYVYLETSDNKEEEKQIALLECNFAWGVDVEGLLKVAREFHVDVKIKTFEKGMEFEQDVEIVDGILVMNEETHYDNYEWECPCPTIGG